jgi:membrane fusion protein (multidrug efflux system)
MIRGRAMLMTLAFLAALAAALGISGCGRQEAVQSAGEETIPVEVVEVTRAAVAPTLSYSGTVEPWRKVLLGAQIQGPVERFHVDVGDRVEKDELLVELGSEQLTQAEAAYAAARKDWERMESLEAKGAVTEQALDHANAAYEAAKAAYEMVLESARIRAPFAGVVSGRLLDEGEVFILMPSGAGAPAVLELSKTDTVKVVIEVAERDRSSVHKGLSAAVDADNQGGRRFVGRIDRVDPGLDRMSRTSTAEIILSNADNALTSGSFARVEVDLDPRQALLVPRDALVRQEGTGVFYAYAVEGGVAHRRDLTLGVSYGDDVEVLDGLSSGDHVAMAGRYRLHDGASVTEVGGGEGAAAAEVGSPGRDPGEGGGR